MPLISRTLWTKRLEALFKTLFFLAGHALDPVIVWLPGPKMYLGPWVYPHVFQQLKLFIFNHVLLCEWVSKYTSQISRMGLLMVHMQKILCSVLICRTCLVRLPFEREHLFADFLDTYLMEVTGEKKMAKAHAGKLQFQRQKYFLRLLGPGTSSHISTINLEP